MSHVNDLSRLLSRVVPPEELPELFISVLQIFNDSQSSSTKCNHNFTEHQRKLLDALEVPQNIKSQTDIDFWEFVYEVAKFLWDCYKFYEGTEVKMWITFTGKSGKTYQRHCKGRVWPRKLHWEARVEDLATGKEGHCSHGTVKECIEEATVDLANKLREANIIQ